MVPTPWGYDAAKKPPALATGDDLVTVSGGRWKADARSAQALLSASATIRSYCGWHIAPLLSCEAQISPRGCFISLPALQVASIDSVVEEGTTLVEGADWDWSKNGLIHRIGHAWKRGLATVVVNYEAGFDDVPDDVLAVCFQMAQRLLAVPFGIKSETADGVSVSYDASVRLTTNETLLLSSYMLPQGV
ncbi:MAG: hypothetical protein LKJ31_06420 [Atopobiaceae bacterium]|nr:hypothetical protein [Atopobiaceae bacterium]